MLLITDRADGSLRLRDALRQIQPVKTLPLAEACKRPANHLFIVCNVDPSQDHTKLMVSAAVKHHRNNAPIPVLMLVPEKSDGLVEDLAELQCDEILDDTIGGGELIEAVRRCRQKQRLSAEPVALKTSDLLLTSLKGAELSLGRLMASARQNQAIRKADLEAGSTALVTMTKHIHIQKWIDVVRRYDDRTYQHCLLVAGLVAAFANAFGYSLESLHVISQAALLHDIGKARIPRALLNKTGALTESERDLIETHCRAGHAMLARQGDLGPAILDVVRHHHEMLDGSGYPDRLSGAKISSIVRIVTICDIYAALIERRSYRAPMSSLAALDTMRAMGPKLDRDMLDHFSKFLVHGS